MRRNRAVHLGLNACEAVFEKACAALYKGLQMRPYSTVYLWQSTEVMLAVQYYCVPLYILVSPHWLLLQWINNHTHFIVQSNRATTQNLLWSIKTLTTSVNITQNNLARILFCLHARGCIILCVKEPSERHDFIVSMATMKTKKAQIWFWLVKLILDYFFMWC